MCNCRKWPCPWNGTQAEGQVQQDEALPESPPETFTSLPPNLALRDVLPSLWVESWLRSKREMVAGHKALFLK